MMAAAEADRDLIYFTFNHESTTQKLTHIMQIIERENLNVGQVYSLINEFADEIRPLRSLDIKNFGLLEFLKTKFSE